MHDPLSLAATIIQQQWGGVEGSGANSILVALLNIKQQKGSAMAINVGTNTQQSNSKVFWWGWTTQGKRAADNTTRGERPMTARRSGSGQHKDVRREAEDTMQGYWAADGMTRGGGGSTHLGD
jgi:hypothetical protein